MTKQEVKLIKYDAACRAIAEAKRVDEVKRIRDVSIALKAYARQARNYELEADAIEIRMRATRRMDQMRQEQKATVGLAKGGRPYQRKATGGTNPPVATLAAAGIDKDLAKEGRKLGALSDQEFEQKVTEARADATSLAEFAERAEKRQKPPKGEAKKHRALTSDDLHRAAAEDFPRWLADIARYFRGHPPSPEMIAEVLLPKQRETILEDAQAIIEFLNEVKRALWEAGKPRPVPTSANGGETKH